jgi:hypothetical protein
MKAHELHAGGFAYVVERDESMGFDPPIGTRVQIYTAPPLPLVRLADNTVWPMPASYLDPEPRYRYSPAAHARVSMRP